MSDDLESKYPGAKITKGGTQPAPEGYSPNRMGENKLENEVARNRSDSRTLAPYEVKAAKFGRAGGAGTGGGSGGAELKSIMNPKSMKSGGKVAGKLATRGYGISKHAK